MTILYLCTGNAARSQMAEAFTRALLPPGAPVEAFSAGTVPKGVHPETVAVMQEAGVEIASARSKGLDEIPVERIDLVVTLCGDARDACPSFPRPVRRLHWGLRDPAAVEGSPDQVRAAFRATRDEILTCVKRFLFELATDRRT